MKVLVTLAVLCLLQVIAGQVTKDGQQHNQDGQGNQQQNSHVLGHQEHSNQNTHTEQQAVAQSQNKKQNVAQQHVAGEQKPTAITHHSSGLSTVSGEIPSKVQQIVNQVAQHVPNVEAQHVANKQRMVRSVKNRQTWQDMQVNAVEQPGKCEYLCNQNDLKVCGYNGRCYWVFEGQCDLSNYNCLNKQKLFHAVDFAKCQDDNTAKCFRGDL